MRRPINRKPPLTVIAAVLASLGLATPALAVTRTVTVATDTVPGSPVGTGAGAANDLRSAIIAANGSSGDSIVFNCGTPCTITLGGPLPVITASMTIDGGANVTIDGNSLYRAFFVESGTVAISNLTVSNAKAQGGSGGNGNGSSPGGGGGGGAGLGAGLFNYGGTVTLSKVRFQNAVAVGGNGGSHASGFGGAGGGGGLAGNGSNGFASSNGAGGGGGGALPGTNGSGSGQLNAGAGGDYGGGGGGAGLIGGMSPTYGNPGNGGPNAYVGTSRGTSGTNASASPNASVGGSGGFGGGAGGHGAGNTSGTAGVAGYGGGGGGSSNASGGAGLGGGGAGGRNSGSKAGSNVVVLDAAASPTVTLAGGIAQGGGGGGAAGGPAVFVHGGTVTTIATTSTGQTATAGDPGASSASPARPGLAASTNNSGGNTYVGADATALLNAGGTVNGSGTLGALADAIPAPTSNMTVATAGTGSGRVTSSFGGINCSGGTGTCSATFDSFDDVTVTTVVLTATAADGSAFDGWSGTCGSGSGTLSVAMTRDRACTATFVSSSGGGSGGSTPSAPPGPPPSFVVAPVAPVISLPALGGGQLSLASSFSSAIPLTFTVLKTDGTPLPNWIIFNPSTVSFTFSPPIPTNLPYQPLVLADGRNRAATAPPNAIHSPAIRIASLPVAITASGAGQSYTTIVLMDFFAPRVPASLSALSLSPDGALGNGATGAAALSWDGGQVVFATAATNLFPASVNNFPDIDRYYGVTGSRDRLSQTAIPGGGVANAAAGLSASPAVSADGAYAAFASDAPGIAAAVVRGSQRQVYRTALGYPRVPLNEAATPAPLLASATAAGLAGNGASDHPALSQDGRYLAFDSTATNFADGLDGGPRVWRKDFATGELGLVGTGTNPSISWDGGFVAFESNGQVLVKDMAAGTTRTIAAGSAPRLTARADRVAFATGATGTISVAYADLATGTVRQVATGDQPDISADGRFVAWRAPGGGFSQVWVRDVERGVTALVSQSTTGQPGAGDSSLPALSGDGATIAFVSAARDLVGGNPTGTQGYVAANPLPLPDRTGYWSDPTAAGGQGWVMERWGSRTYVGGLLYDANGQPGWTSGFCTLDGLACRGSLVPQAGGAVFGAATGAGPTAGPATAFTVTSAADGRSATLQFGNAAPQTLQPLAIGGSATTAYSGLPEAGWWVETGSTGGNGYFLGLATQTSGSAVVQAAQFGVLTFDAAGRPVWYSAQANLGADFSFSGMLSQYTAAGGATPVGALRLTFQGTERATAVLPNGRVAQLQRWRF